MAKTVALFLLLLISGTIAYASYKGIIFPFLVQPFLKPKQPQ